LVNNLRCLTTKKLDSTRKLLPHQGIELPGQRGMELERLAIDRMPELEIAGVQQHSMTSQVLAEQAVVPPLPVGRVADDGVKQMLEMAAQLVHPAGPWPRLDRL
jgi:hypothetical protein